MLYNFINMHLIRYPQIEAKKNEQKNYSRSSIIFFLCSSEGHIESFRKWLFEKRFGARAEIELGVV